MRVELKFATRAQAKEFSRAWVFHTLTGTLMSAGAENVTVQVYDVDDSKKEWIDQYVNKLCAQ